jgi:hypothetical protein
MDLFDVEAASISNQRFRQWGVVRFHILCHLHELVPQPHLTHNHSYSYYIAIHYSATTSTIVVCAVSLAMPPSPRPAEQSRLRSFLF